MACAKCHDHKYDPISQRNYYEMYSFFNNVNESGQISFDSSMPVPNMLLPTDEQEEFIDLCLMDWLKIKQKAIENSSSSPNPRMPGNGLKVKDIKILKPKSLGPVSSLLN